MSLPDSCTIRSFSQASGCSAASPISLASTPASSVSSVSDGEETIHRKGSSVNSPMSLVPSLACSANACGTSSVHGEEALKTNASLDSGSGGTTRNSSLSPVAEDKPTIPSLDNRDRIQALMAKYEQVMSGDGAQTQCTSSGSPSAEDRHIAILPRARDPDHRTHDKPTKPATQHRETASRGARGGKKGHSGVQSRVQKKGASVSRRQTYAFERLGGARRAARGSIEYEVYWASTWLPLDQLEGNDAIQEAKNLVVDLFGSKTWQMEAQKLGLRL
ncbi:hypothetical protein PWT90_06452 [Aphanocladium album]|nr:hypothetical protein PWT90_06452 [Aphanocladium album]